MMEFPDWVMTLRVRVALVPKHQIPSRSGLTVGANVRRDSLGGYLYRLMTPFGDLCVLVVVGNLLATDG